MLDVCYIWLYDNIIFLLQRDFMIRKLICLHSYYLQTVSWRPLFNHQNKYSTVVFGPMIEKRFLWNSL